jgi:hypothetical protein
MAPDASPSTACIVEITKKVTSQARPVEKLLGD